MIEWVILGLLLVIVVLFSAWAFDGEGVWALIGIVVIGWSMWHWRDTPEESAAKEAQKAAEKLARETPRVIREADGCKVYAFEKSGREHFFTRCPATTDTETTWSESCGKNCRREKSSNILTENK
jgi:hypothetical protein